MLHASVGADGDGPTLMVAGPGSMSHGQYGNLAGEQTVPRAEAMALKRFIEFATGNLSSGAYNVYVDAKTTISGFRNRKKKQYHEPIWRDIVHLTERHPEYDFIIHKVHAHAIEKGIEQPDWMTEGNDDADRLAKLGAKLNELDWGFTKRLSLTDAFTTMVQKRIITIAKQFSVRHKVIRIGLQISMPSPIDEKIRANGHEIVSMGKVRYCLTCGQSWTKDKRTAILEAGKCLGPSGLAEPHSFGWGMRSI